MDGSLAGVISDRDLLRAANDYESDTTLIADVMTSRPITVRPETPLSGAAAMAFEYRFNCFLVVNESGKVAGILTTTDILKAFCRLQLSVEGAND